MAATTVKYVLKKDRKQIIEIKSPLFGMAHIVDASGKTTKELSRGELDRDYEPLLAPANPKGVDVSRPDARSQQFADITESLSDLHSKIDKIMAIVVPPEKDQ